jgi:Predicted metal binding domain
VQVDPEVNRAKYDREISLLVEQQTTLESRLIFMLSSTAYPHIDLLFVPRHPLQIPGLTTQVGSIILAQPTVTFTDLPMFAGRAFKARFDLTDYDLRAPSLEFRDAWTDAELQYPTMFRARQFEGPGRAPDVLLADHPTTHKPFLCLRGIREYHEHPQHSGDEWLLYRETLHLFSIVMSLWRVSVDLVHPQLNFQMNRMQVQWAAEEKL